MEEKNVLNPVELNDEQMEKSSGGAGGSGSYRLYNCPECNKLIRYRDNGEVVYCSCPACGANLTIG